MKAVPTLIVIVMFLVVLAVMAIFLSFARMWLRAVMSGVQIPFMRIVAMRLRGNPAQLLVDAHILLSKDGVQSTLDETEHMFMQKRNRIHTAEELVRLVKSSKQK